MIGFDATKLRLLAAYQNNKLPHAILLGGKKGIGKASFAKEFALELLGTGALLARDGTADHPDLLLLKKEDGKREIGVEQVREISGFVNQTSSISKNKFIIIDAADDLNRSSANALLKILEEPHDNNFLILVAHNLSKVLPTIKSRCQIINVAPLTFAQFAQVLLETRPKFLPKIPDDEIKILGDICDNSPALAIQSQEDLTGLYAEFLSSIKNKKLGEILLKKIADKNFNFEIFTLVVNFFLKRLSLYHTGQIDYFIFDEKEVFATLNTKFSAEEIFTLSDEARAGLARTLSLNLDKKLFLINLFNRICF